jgi:hypothetical protein
MNATDIGILDDAQVKVLENTAYYPKPGDGPVLTKKQRTLPEALKKKIIESKKSGAGYSGD